MPDLFDEPFEEPAVSREEIPPVRARRRVVTVSEVTAEIRSALESGFGELWIEGEISNCRVWNTGHVYFTLKDPTAQLKAVMFRSASRYLKFKIEDGIHVVARGRLSVYDPKGEYQLVCEHLEPHGRGALQLAFEQLKRKLHAEGLFYRPGEFLEPGGIHLGKRQQEHEKGEQEGHQIAICNEPLWCTRLGGVLRHLDVIVCHAALLIVSPPVPFVVVSS